MHPSTLIAVLLLPLLGIAAASPRAAGARLQPRRQNDDGKPDPNQRHPFTWHRDNMIRCTNKCYKQVGGWGPPPWGDEERMNSCVGMCQHY